MYEHPEDKQRRVVEASYKKNKRLKKLWKELHKNIGQPIKSKKS